MAHTRRTGACLAIAFSVVAPAAALAAPAPDADVDALLAQLLGDPAHRSSSEAAGKLPDDGPSPDVIGRTNTRDKAVLLVHGRDNYNPSGWAGLRNLYITTYGFTGGVHRVGYYGGECNVEHRAEHHGSHGTHYGGSGEHSAKTGCIGGATQVHDLDTDIRHIAYHVAWMVYDHWTASGKAVDYVGHSLGGLLVRYAVAKAGTSGFPPRLYVEDVTTFAAPHGGLGNSWCRLSPWSDVRQMCSTSDFMVWLDTNAQNPQSAWATDWTLMGSDCDTWVAWNLAVDMTAAHKVVAVSPCLGHSGYYTETQTTNDATMDYMDAPDPTWYRWTAPPMRASGASTRPSTARGSAHTSRTTNVSVPPLKRL